PRATATATARATKSGVSVTSSTAAAETSKMRLSVRCIGFRNLQGCRCVEFFRTGSTLQYMLVNSLDLRGCAGERKHPAYQAAACPGHVPMRGRVVEDIQNGRGQHAGIGNRNTDTSDAVNHDLG